MNRSAHRSHSSQLLRWPDRTLAAEYVGGHKVVGHIETSGIFRPLPVNEITQEELERGFMGQEAERFIDMIVTRPPGPDELDKNDFNLYL